LRTNMNAAQKKPDPRDLRYLQFAAGRHQVFSDEEIARELEFNSPSVLYQRLKERSRVYEMLQLEVRPDPEGYEVSGALCSSRPTGRHRSDSANQYELRFRTLVNEGGTGRLELSRAQSPTAAGEERSLHRDPGCMSREISRCSRAEI
jgi:hypothetical protein